MSRQKILFHLNTFPLIGNIVPLVNKISYWQNAGYTVTVFASPGVIKKIRGQNLLATFQVIIIESKSESSNKFRFMFECIRRNIISLKYLEVIEKGQFQVLYTISSVLDLVLIPALLKFRRKHKFLWMTVFDNTVPFTGSGNKLIRFLNWLFFKISVCLVRKADRIFTPSSNVWAYLEKKKFRLTQIVSTGNGVEIELIKRAKKRDGSSFDALFVGRIHEAKGIYEMLRVLDLVKKKLPNFHLALMGEGEKETVKRFQSVINEMELGNNISFLGYKTGQEKYDIIKSSKSFWFFSESEGFPQALMEAVSSGLKCFVYDLPAYDYYKNNELMVFNQKDHKAVAEAVINLFSKKDFYNKIGASQLKNFSWERISKIELESIKDNFK